MTQILRFVLPYILLLQIIANIFTIYFYRKCLVLIVKSFMLYQHGNKRFSSRKKNYFNQIFDVLAMLSLLNSFVLFLNKFFIIK